ncbi:S41 family peptidase [Pseudoramibacter sp.]|jgi:carboxyl-terminal processing protease|uniref:S41 family peptidase n=1 Tax=Pseudoramibacter sp. TaxID=2034862 RepID=UPI0025FA373B|nr:S41 family peptidase [Pseudoramibacter sp.]MCH4072806.1 S41 family peptidase [Pseudoramibacter sp.]MCH4106577.1 S41 family peptidase [Pseudoramibacter sp.]
MKAKKRNIIIITIIVLTNLLTFLLTGVGILRLKHHYVYKANTQEIATSVNKFALLENSIQRNYYKKVSIQKVSDEAYKGMFKSLGDKYSIYYDKKEYNKLNEEISGSYYGIGVVLSEDEQKNAYVASVMKNSPADKAGIKSGDIIKSIDGKIYLKKGASAVAKKVRSKTSSSYVNLTILRNNQEKTFKIRRTSVQNATVASQTFERNGKKIGYIYITEFAKNTDKEFETQLALLKKQKIKGLIIDLRENGGGIVDTSVNICDQLISKGNVVTTKGRNGNDEDYQATSKAQVKLPMAILVNQHTASASEILTGAMQDYKKATIIGTQTFGKGIVQGVTSLQDGTGYQLTIAQYYTPKGRNINKKGITPDIIVSQDNISTNYLTQNDLQFEKAIEVLTSEIKNK